MPKSRTTTALTAAAMLTATLLLAPHAGARGATAAVHGDLDGDGRADLVIARAHGITVFYTGGMGRHTIGVPANGYVSGVASGDFNADGYGDVAVGDSLVGHDANGLTSDGAVYVFYGSPSGLSAPTTIAGKAGAGRGFGDDLVSADVNGDHRSDLLVVDDNGYTDIKPRLTVLLGRPGGLSAAHELHLGRQHASSVAVGDLNADGYADLVIGRPETGKTVLNNDNEVDAQEGTIAVYYGRAHGFSSHPQVIHGLRAGVGYGAFGTSLSIAKINGDRYADIVAGAPTTSLDSHGRPARKYFSAVPGAGTVAVLYGSRTGVDAARRSVLSLATHGVPGTPGDGDDFGQHVATGDLNGDGRVDVIAEMDQEFNGRDGAVFVFRGAASGVSTSHVQRIGSHVLGNPHHRNYEAMLYGSALTVFRPTNAPFASLAIGAPGYIKSAKKWLGFVDVLPGSNTGPTTQGAYRVFGNLDKDNFGAYLAK